MKKKEPKTKGFLGSPRSAELLFGQAVRNFIKRIEKLIEDGKNEKKRND